MYHTAVLPLRKPLSGFKLLLPVSGTGLSTVIAKQKVKRSTDAKLDTLLPWELLSIALSVYSTSSKEEDGIKHFNASSGELSLINSILWILALSSATFNPPGS